MSYVTPKKNTAFIFYTGLTSQALRPQLKVNPTLAAGDVKVSINGGAFANLVTLPTVTPAAGAAVQVSLSAAEMNGDNIVVLFSDAAGAEWDDLFILIQTTTQQIDDVAKEVGGNVGLIKAKTDNLPVDPAVESLVIAATNAISVDTAAIKAKTNNLPALPAAVADIPTTVAITNAIYNENLANHIIVGSGGQKLMTLQNTVGLAILVKNSLGALLVNVQVTIRSQDLSTFIVAGPTGADGQVVFALAPGTYKVLATLAGYAPLSPQLIQVATSMSASVTLVAM